LPKPTKLGERVAAIGRCPQAEKLIAQLGAIGSQLDRLRVAEVIPMERIPQTRNAPDRGRRRRAFARPTRAQSMTFESYAELRDGFRALVHADGEDRGLWIERRELLLRQRRARHHRAVLQKDRRGLLATRMTSDLWHHRCATGDRCGRRGAPTPGDHRDGRDLRLAPEARPLSSTRQAAGCDMGPARSCRASSGRAARQSFSIPAAA
jgi:hypothetical protein